MRQLEAEEALRAERSSSARRSARPERQVGRKNNPHNTERERERERRRKSLDRSWFDLKAPNLVTGVRFGLSAEAATDVKHVKGK